MTDSLDQALQECLELLHHGVSVEECLARYQESAEELEPLLRTAVTMEHQLTQSMPQLARARVRARVLAEWGRRHESRRRRWTLPLFVPRWAAVAASLLLAIMVGGTGTVAAAEAAIPGDILYPVKEFREEAVLWLTLSPEARIVRYAGLVNERARELQSLTAKNRVDDLPIALRRLNDHVESIDALIETEVGGQAVEDAHLLETLQDYMTVQQLTEGLLEETLGQATLEAQPDIEGALSTLQEALERVQAALEATE